MVARSRYWNSCCPGRLRHARTTAARRRSSARTSCILPDFSRNPWSWAEPTWRGATRRHHFVWVARGRNEPEPHFQIGPRARSIGEIPASFGFSPSTSERPTPSVSPNAPCPSRCPTKAACSPREAIPADTIDQISEQQLDHTFRTNSHGYFHMVQPASPHLPPGGSFLTRARSQGSMAVGASSTMRPPRVRSTRSPNRLRRTSGRAGSASTRSRPARSGPH